MQTARHSKPFTIVYPTPKGETATAYPAAVGIPIIFDRRPGGHLLALRFLLDVAYAKWRFPTGFREAVGAKKLTRKSLKDVAERLCNFLDWADRRSVDLHRCTYDKSVGRYQLEMVGGAWSRSGDGLAEATVNVRVDVAVQYMRWMADVGERDRFDVQLKEVTQSYGRHDSSVRTSKTVIVREGRLTMKPRLLTLPERSGVLKWLREAKKSGGTAFELMAKSILRAGMRREEVVCLRVNSLPLNVDDWSVVNPLQPPHLQEIAIKIEWGCKGQTLEICPLTDDERKPGRTIRVPRTLALEWHEYRKKERVQAVGKRLSGLKGKQREDVAASLVHLFLRDDNGNRWTGKDVWDAWASVPREFTGKWHPHVGRHWWACMTLWDEIQRLEADSRSKENLLSIITTRIRPQLGHGSDQTTMLYLSWALNQLGAPLVLDEWDEGLDHGNEFTED